MVTLYESNRLLGRAHDNLRVASFHDPSSYPRSVVLPTIHSEPHTSQIITPAPLFSFRQGTAIGPQFTIILRPHNIEGIDLVPLETQEVAMRISIFF